MISRPVTVLGAAAEPDLSDAADFLRARRAPADAPQAEQGQEEFV